MSIVFIISAPSGSGKSTLVNHLLQQDRRLLFSVSYTTRAPRGQEVEGQSYHYISRSEFESMIQREEFLEWARVFERDYYGTHRGYLERARAANLDLVLDIDVQGARQLKERMPDAVSIFVLAPSRAILEKRLRARGEDSEDTIERRLREAGEEIRNYGRYDYILINDQVSESAVRLQSIVEAERMRRFRMEAQVRPVLASFGMTLEGGKEH